MENLYSQSKILSEKDFKKLEKVFEEVWSNDSTFPDNAKGWSSENKAFGQCAPTSLVVNDMFGGRMIYDKANFHIWNELTDGTQQDFSRVQFKDKRTFSVYKYKIKEEMLNDEIGLRTNLLGRYSLLKNRVVEELGKSKI